MKKIRVLIDYPISESSEYKGLSFPQVLYNYLKTDERFEVVTDVNAKKLDIIVVISGGSQYESQDVIFIKKLRAILPGRFKVLASITRLFINKFFKFKILQANHTYYEKRLKKIRKNNPNAKIVHRLDDRYRALCKVYGFDETIKRINKVADVTVHQSNYCQKIWDEGINTIFGFEEGFKTVNPVRLDNGVDTNTFKPEGDKIELEGKYKIVHVSATGMPRKGLKTVLFYAEMLKNNPDYQFYLVGRQETDPLSGNKIKDYDNVHQLEFTSNREVLAKYYRSCDVMLFPSVGDCSPNVVLEAMATGLPMVALNSGGTPEMIIKEDMQAGLLIDEKNPIFALKTVTENLEEFSENAVKVVEKYHSIEVMGKNYAELFIETLKRDK